MFLSLKKLFQSEQADSTSNVTVGTTNPSIDNVEDEGRTISKSSRSHLCSSSERTRYRSASRGRGPKANATMDKMKGKRRTEEHRDDKMKGQKNFEKQKTFPFTFAFSKYL